ncbi:MAG: hypothetical protein K0S65_1920 [Labilithrix sp.]|nr:hypothetical protein [Labilithrix sp.]
MDSSTRPNRSFARSVGVIAGLVVSGSFFACAAGEDDGIDLPLPAADGSTPESQTVPDGSSSGSSSNNRDASTSTKDSGKGEIDYGPPGPIGPPTGSDCSKPGEEFEHTCGQCGVQVAICIDGKVGAYGPCRDEKVGPTNCIPGMSSTLTCGYCGSKIRACRNDCTWTETKCKGEVTGKDRCMPGDVEKRVADCNDGENRTYTCAETCAWGAPTACAPAGQ